MLVSRILLELDAQLERLQTARDTIASLIAPTPAKPGRTAATRAAKTAKPAEAAKATPRIDAVIAAAAEAVPFAAVVPDVAAAATAPVPAKRRGRPKGSVNRRPGGPRTRAARPSEPTALAHAVATGPVFVSAAELDRRRQQALEMAAPKPDAAAASEGTLDALIREVAERRTAA